MPMPVMRAIGIASWARIRSRQLPTKARTSDGSANAIGKWKRCRTWPAKSTQTRVRWLRSTLSPSENAASGLSFIVEAGWPRTFSRVRSLRIRPSSIRSRAILNTAGVVRPVMAARSWRRTLPPVRMALRMTLRLWTPADVILAPRKCDASFRSESRTLLTSRNCCAFGMDNPLFPACAPLGESRGSNANAHKRKLVATFLPNNAIIEQFLCAALRLLCYQWLFFFSN